MALIRLDKYLADMQVGTRSQVKDIIKKGKVQVNGEIIRSPELKIDMTNCDVSVDGNSVGYTQTEYYMMNKPSGVLSATVDKKQKTVLDLIKDNVRKDLFPVGRLDKDTEGLLLITNDGELAHNLLSPKKHVDKTYYAVVKGRINNYNIEQFADGIVINENFKTMPAKLEILDCNEEKSKVLVTIREGKFHQIKKMFIAIDSEVLYLKRLTMGPLKLDESLQPGQYRKLTDCEIKSLIERHKV